MALVILFLSFAILCSFAEKEEEEDTREIWAVQLPDGQDPTVFAEYYQLELVSTVAPFSDTFLFSFSPRERSRSPRSPLFPPPFDSSPELKTKRDEEVSYAWMEKQIPKKMETRFTVPPKDPLYPDQWNLERLKVSTVWEKGITGKKVQVAIVDDGLEWRNEDLYENYNSQGSWDINHNKADPTSTKNVHGTAVAGVVGASSNSFCGVGVAPEVKIAGLKLVAESFTDAQGAKGLSYRNDINYIYSNSWGPSDDGLRLEGPGKLSQRAIFQSIQEGRQGKGSVYVWAAGNGAEKGDNGNYDGFANSIYTIAVGAIDSNGVRSPYSEKCSCLICSAPSSGAPGDKEIISTTLTIRRGCFSEFGGTSAASPQVAGVIALLLQEYPYLTWRDIQGLLVETSKKVDTSNFDWQMNGAGLSFSHEYGFDFDCSLLLLLPPLRVENSFGLVDPVKAVESAKTWEMYSSQQIFQSGPIKIDDPIVQSHTQYSFEINKTMITEHIEVIFDCKVTHRGELAISLQSPTGMISQLAEFHGDQNADFPQWKMTTVAHWGELSGGNWSLIVKKNGGGSSAKVQEFQIIVYGREVGEGQNHPYGQNPSSRESHGLEEISEEVDKNSKWMVVGSITFGSIILLVVLVVSVLKSFSGAQNDTRPPPPSPSISMDWIPRELENQRKLLREASWSESFDEFSDEEEETKGDSLVSMFPTPPR